MAGRLEDLADVGVNLNISRRELDDLHIEVGGLLSHRRDRT